MYLNNVTLIGFLGNDAEVRYTTDQRSITTLSLATQSSYKKGGQYVRDTEWHKLVVFGKLSTFAGTLKKGAHLHITGELRSRSYGSKRTGAEQRVWEIRVRSILNLDRAEQVAADEQDTDGFHEQDAAV